MLLSLLCMEVGIWISESIHNFVLNCCFCCLSIKNIDTWHLYNHNFTFIPLITRGSSLYSNSKTYCAELGNCRAWKTMQNQIFLIFWSMTTQNILNAKMDQQADNLGFCSGFASWYLIAQNKSIHHITTIDILKLSSQHFIKIVFLAFCSFHLASPFFLILSEHNFYLSS